MTETNDQVPVEQAPQAGANPAAPAGEGATSPAQDAPPASRDTPESTTAPAPELPPAGDEGSAPEAGNASGDTTPGGVPPDAATLGAPGGDTTLVLVPGTAPVVLVQGPAQGRWRAGRPFGPELVAIPRSELSDADLVALTADPQLMVRVV